MFSYQPDKCTQIVHIFDIIFLFAAPLEEPKIGIWGKGLKYKHIFKPKIQGLLLSKTMPGFSRNSKRSFMKIL